MSSGAATAGAGDRDARNVHRAGGIAAVGLAVSYIVITGLFVVGGALPAGAEKWLEHLSGRATAWWAILGLSVLTDVLFLVVAWALYRALKPLHPSAALAGTGLLVLFALLDLAVTWPNYASLISMSALYARAAGDAQRAAVVTAAQYPTAVLSSTLFGVYAILVPSIGALILGLVMLRGVFARTTAYCGVLSGILGIVAVAGPFVVSGTGVVAVPASVLTTAWVFLLGVRLVRLARASSAAEGTR